MEETGSVQGLPAKGDSGGASVEDGSPEVLSDPAVYQWHLPDPAEQSYPEGVNMMDSSMATKDKVMVSGQGGCDQMTSGQGAGAQTMVSGQSIGDQTVASGQGAGSQTMVSGQSSGDQTMVSGQSIGDQTMVSGQSIGDQTVVSGHSVGEQTTVTADPSLELGEAAVVTEEPSPGVTDLPLEIRDPSDVTEETPQQSEGMSTDRASLSYTGEPRLLTSITAPFSADNFTKGCKWSPDGTCLLVCSEDGCLRVLNLPEPLYGAATTGAAPEAPLSPPQVALQSREGELIYDYTWFPLMRSDDPATCCYASTSRAHPVHLFDAFDGGLRCSYRAYNNVDEVTAAYSVTFDPAGERLFAGLDGSLSVFDVSRPGRQIETRKMKDKQSLTSQPGIVSSVRFCAAAPDVYAAATYLRSIGVYGTEDGAPLCILQGQAGGVTHLQFSPDGRRLYSGGRKDPEILCWDLRNLGRILFSMQRNVTTNQRVYFDTDWSGRFLFSGDCDGCVQLWDTMADPSDVCDTLLLPSTRKFDAHGDCCNGVSVHPWLPVLATSSGQRHLAGLLDSSDEEDVGTPPRSRAESSVGLWWLAD